MPNLTQRGILREIKRYLRRTGGEVCYAEAPMHMDATLVYFREGLNVLLQGPPNARYVISGLDRLIIGDRRKFKRALAKGRIRREGVSFA